MSDIFSPKHPSHNHCTLHERYTKSNEADQRNANKRSKIISAQACNTRMPTTTASIDGDSDRDPSQDGDTESMKEQNCVREKELKFLRRKWKRMNEDGYDGGNYSDVDNELEQSESDQPHSSEESVEGSEPESDSDQEESEDNQSFTAAGNLDDIKLASIANENSKGSSSKTKAPIPRMGPFEWKVIRQGREIRMKDMNCPRCRRSFTRATRMNEHFRKEHPSEDIPFPRIGGLRNTNINVKERREKIRAKHRRHDAKRRSKV